MKTKSRSQRNRKRPRSQARNNDDLVVQTKIVSLRRMIKRTMMNDDHDHDDGDDDRQSSSNVTTSSGNDDCFGNVRLRLVEPYPYTFSSHAKMRWIGRTVLNVYAKEFGSYPESYYETAIRQGRILVSDHRVDPSYRIQGHDVLTHTVHRHEPAVAVAATAAAAAAAAATTTTSQGQTVSTTAATTIAEPETSATTTPLVHVVAETDDLLVIDKPATLPIHPCGGYHMNSLMNLLEQTTSSTSSSAPSTSSPPPTAAASKTPLVDQKSPPQQKLYTIHRLDRLTSGLAILGKNRDVAKDWGKAIQQRDACEKLYLARIRGRFPLACPESISTGALSSVGSNKFTDCGPPLYGEWVEKATAPAEATSSEGPRRKKQKVAANEKDDSVAAVAARNRNALVCWVTEQSGKPLDNDEGFSMQKFSSVTNSVQEWLEVLNNSQPGSAEKKELLWLHLACPVRVEQPKIGVCAAGAFADLDDSLYRKTVKPAQTSFAIIRYDAETDSTVVLCKPWTGRTHQIRLHLQYLGHPIANDPNYGGTLWYGNPEGERACLRAKKRLDAMDSMNKTELNEKKTEEDQTDVSENQQQQSLVTTDVPATAGEIQRMSGVVRLDEESIDDFIRRTCVWCARSRGKEEERTVLEFLVRSPGIWLHALQYKVTFGGGNGESAVFQTELPPWS